MAAIRESDADFRGFYEAMTHRNVLHATRTCTFSLEGFSLCSPVEVDAMGCVSDVVGTSSVDMAVPVAGVVDSGMSILVMRGLFNVCSKATAKACRASLT